MQASNMQTGRGKLTNRLWLGFLLGACLIALATGCDDTDSFKIRNETETEITATVTVLDSDGEGIETHTYVIPPEETINTVDERSIEGYKGGVLFGKHDGLLLCGYSEEVLVYERTLSYEDVKERDFSFEVASTASTNGVLCSTDLEGD